MIRLKVLEDVRNVFENIIPKEFTADEIAEIRTVFPKAYSKKRYSLYNPHNLLSESCQWYDDKLYVEMGYKCDLTIVKGKVYISYYEVKYDRPPPLEFLPNQYGLAHVTREWETIEDLKKIKERL